MDMLRGAIDQIVSFLPAFFAGLIVLAIGWIVAAAVSRIIRAVLPRIGFDRFLARHKVTGRSPEKHPGSNAVAKAAGWVIMLIALMQAANIWGLAIVANGLAAAIRYLPNVVAAVLIFGAAFVLGNWCRDRLRSSPAEARYSSVAMLPSGVRAGILTIGGFVALRQLGIAPEILIIAFTLVFGAIAVAMALAFGLGGRRTAERMTQDWYERQRPRQTVADETDRYRYREPPPERPGIH